MAARIVGLLALWLATALLGAATVVRADAVVRVRAETRIELDVRRAEGGLRVRGILRDDAGGVVPGRTVNVAVRPDGGPAIASFAAQTDAAGRFEREVSAPPDGYVVDATFDGESDLLGSTARIRLDRERAHVVLLVALEGGNRVSLDEPDHRLVVTATSEAGGAGLPITIESEIGGEVASGLTEADGSLTVDVRSETLGPPAAGRLVVRSSGDATRSPAQTEVPVVRFRQARIEWLDEERELTAHTVLRGRLGTATGPLERRAVGIYVDGEHVGTRLTGTGGELAIPLDPGVAGDRPAVSVEARFDADAPWLASCASSPRRLEIRQAPRVVPVLAVSSGVLVALIALWLRRRPVPGVITARSSLPPGVLAARPTTLLPQHRGLSGRVVHASSGAVLAEVEIRCGGRAVQSARDGTFAIEVPDGSHLLVAQAPGFEPIEHRVGSPHRGEWLGMTVRLESRRDLASRALLDVLTLVVPRERTATATDRELLDAARERGAGWPELVELVDAVERLVYGEGTPAREDLEHVRALARRARGRAVTRVDSASRASL